MQNDNEIIYGKNAILEALVSNQRNINKILGSKNNHIDKKTQEIIDWAREKRVLFKFVNKEKFQELQDVAHQGVMAYIAPIEYMDLYDFLAEKKEISKVIILDGIEDPHNLGAIIRSAVCAGFDGIIIPQRRNVLATNTVEKTSAGAINHIKMIKVNSLQNAIEVLKDNNYWIIATDMEAKDNYFDIDYNGMNFALVMGSEGFGVGKTTLKHADFTVKIPIIGNFESLNVANAASIIIYESIRQMIQKPKNNV